MKGLGIMKLFYLTRISTLETRDGVLKGIGTGKKHSEGDLNPYTTLKI